MKQRDKLFLLTLLVISSVSIMVLLVNRKEPGYKPGLSYESDLAVNQARVVFNQKKTTKEDFSDGPCLTNALMPGWVLDLVHVPRIAADDLPENQCSSYLEGSVKNLVELDLNGDIVRVVTPE